MACPPAFQTDAASAAAASGRRRRKLSLSLATVASLSVSCYRPEVVPSPPPLSVSVPASARALSLSSLAAAPSSFPLLLLLSPSSPLSSSPSLSSVVHSSLVSLRRRLLERAAACPSLPLSSLSVVAFLSLPLPSSPTVQSRRGRRRVFLPRRTPKQQENQRRRRGVGRSRVSREGNQVCWCMVGTQEMR